MADTGGNWLFSTPLTIRISDLNYGGHLGNDRVLTLFHEIRVRWLAEAGWTELDIEGVGLIQTEAQLRYRSQGHLGERLEGRLRVDSIKSRGFTLAYQLWSETAEREIASGTTTLRFFNYAEQTLAKAPAAFLKKFA